MNTNAEYCPASRRYASQGFAKVSSSLVLAPRSTSNAEHRTQEAKIAARMAHRSLLVLFGSALEVRCSMFDVRISLRSIRLAASCNRRGSRAATAPSDQFVRLRRFSFPWPPKGAGSRLRDGRLTHKTVVWRRLNPPGKPRLGIHAFFS